MKTLVEEKAQDSQQFLTFLLEDQEYGLEIFKIREIRGYAPITPIPNVPPHVRGVMNLRGTVLPVVDLRMKFRLPAVEYSKYTVIVIATVGEKTVGLLVDAVSDVLIGRQKTPCAKHPTSVRQLIRGSSAASSSRGSGSPSH